MKTELAKSKQGKMVKENFPEGEPVVTLYTQDVNKTHCLNRVGIGLA